jgi:hypothetical protein
MDGLVRACTTAFSSGVAFTHRENLQMFLDPRTCLAPADAGVTTLIVNHDFPDSLLMDD